MSNGVKNYLFSGIRPTGELHIGNYFGAIVNWIKLKDKYNCIYCVVDYHAITTPFDPKKLKETILETAALYVACGIDPEKSILFRQSDIKEHTELAWILGCLTSFGDLKRMTQFKEKSLEHPEAINAGLFNYPVLMAADILLYKALYVPVGQDQIQHVELARTIARIFNKKFGFYFPEPQVVLSEGAKIMSLTNPEKKMSKSATDENSYISLDEKEKDIYKKLAKAVTDPARKRRNDPGNPDKCNIFKLHQLVSSGKEIGYINLECRRAGIGCLDCKKILANNLIKVLKPIQENKNKLLKNPKKLEKILEKGAKKAHKIAQKTMTEVKEKIGLKL